jgi:RNA polymerase sigma-70 factor (ECF subfamily)
MDQQAMNAPGGTQHGDRLTPLFEASASELLGTLYFMLGNREDARDAAQETYLKCWKKRAELGAVRDLRAWVFNVALDTARDLRKSAWRRRARPLPEDENVLTLAARPTEAAGTGNAEELGRVRQEIQRLPEGEREVFLLRENGGLSYAEIAAASGAPLGTVKTRMRSALARLRRALAVPAGDTDRSAGAAGGFRSMSPVQ